jgi:hypothetical protein
MTLSMALALGLALARVGGSAQYDHEVFPGWTHRLHDEHSLGLQ